MTTEERDAAIVYLKSIKAETPTLMPLAVSVIDSLQARVRELESGIERIRVRASPRPVHVCDVDTFRDEARDLQVIEREATQLLATGAGGTTKRA